jgi:hypothetical protein
MKLIFHILCGACCAVAVWGAITIWNYANYFSVASSDRSVVSLERLSQRTDGILIGATMIATGLVLGLIFAVAATSYDEKP